MEQGPAARGPFEPMPPARPEPSSVGAPRAPSPSEVPPATTASQRPPATQPGSAAAGPETQAGRHVGGTQPSGSGGFGDAGAPLFNWTSGWPLVPILILQAALSARLIRADTAFQDEALYLWAGHLEWASLLHGGALPQFPAFFSGAPVIYPPLAALVDSVGGLDGARLLSLAFMLGATALLYATSGRLFGKWAAFFSAVLFAIISPTLHLGSFA